MNPSDESWRENVKKALDGRAAEVDGNTRSRLNRIRQDALDQVRHASGARWWPGGLLAASAVVLLAIGLGGRQPAAPQLPAEQTPPEVALLSSNEALDMLEELEFYVWLDEALVDAG